MRNSSYLRSREKKNMLNVNTYDYEKSKDLLPYPR